MTLLYSALFGENIALNNPSFKRNQAVESSKKKMQGV